MNVVYENHYGMKCTVDHGTETAFIDQKFFNELSDIGKAYILKWCETMLTLRHVSGRARERICDTLTFAQLCKDYSPMFLADVYIKELSTVFI